MTSHALTSDVTTLTDVKITCQQLVELVTHIKGIYLRVLKKEVTLQGARPEIQGLLSEHLEYLIRDKTNIVALFPDDQLFIHLNQSYYAPSSGHEHTINLNLTLTPSPSGHRITLLVHPNVIINDTTVDLFDLLPLQYSARPVFKGRETHHICLLQRHDIDWSYAHAQHTYPSKPMTLTIHPGDKIIFHARDNLDYTVTSANARYEISINPDYDLTLLAGNQTEVILSKPGDYYFVSRAHRKYLQLYVHVKNCPKHPI